MNHIGLQLFVARLRASINDELMKNMPAFRVPTLWRRSPSTKPSSVFYTVNEIDTERLDDELELEINTVSAQIARLKSCKTGGFQP